MKKSDYNKLGSYKIKRKKKSILGFRERNSKYTFASLKVVLADESKYFENIQENLGIALDGGDPYPKLENIEIDDLTFLTDAYFAEQKIRVKDEYSHESVVKEDLKLKLLFKPSQDSEKQKEKVIVKTVVREKQNAIAKISIHKNKKYREAALFDNKEKNDHFGILIIENIADYHSYPLVIENLTLKLVNGNGDKICEGETLTTDLQETITINPKGKEELILNIDLSKFKHPKKDIEYTIVVEGKKKNNEESFVPIESNKDFTGEDSFKIKPNEIDTDLFLDVNGADKTTTKYDDKIQVNNVAYDLKEDLKKTITNIKLGNRSNVRNDDNNDYIEVTGLSISKTISPVNKDQRNEAFKSKIRDLIKIDYKLKSGDTWSEIQEDDLQYLTFKNGADSFIRISVYVNTKDFEILDNNLQNPVNIELTLRFNYVIKDHENRERKQSEEKKYILNFELKQHPGDEWLAIDYGTSAIVAQYGTTQSNKIQNNIKSQFRSLLESLDEKYIYADVDYEEEGDALLSSTVTLRKGKSLSGKFEDSTVSISPKKTAIYSGSEYMLPYLKSLVGHERFPDVFLELIKEEELRDLKPIIIIKEVYSILLNSLVIPSYDGIRKNKIILTIPNSFTARHKKILKEIVKRNLECVWDDYIVFVSESDAVAWYYIDHKYNLLRDALDEAKARERDVKKLKDEVVLVYDMGAGTLDLTLFRIQEENKITEIEILGRIGQISGGNYADYVIGLEFWKQVKNLEGKDFNPMKARKHKDFLNEKIRYKMFVRDKLKLAMNTLNQSKIVDKRFYGDNYKTPNPVNFEKLVESDSYQDYLRKNSTDILALLKSTFGLENNTVKIDTVLLSGRGVQLRGLKEALFKAVKEEFSNSDPLAIQVKGENLKTIVSKGAIYYASRKKSPDIKFKPLKLSARYGVLKRIRGQEYEYEELLNANSDRKENIEFESDTIEGGMEATLELGNLNGVEEIIVIRTYLQKDMIHLLRNDHTSTQEKSLETYYQSSSHIIHLNRSKSFDLENNTLTLVIDDDSEVHIKFNNDVKREFIVPASDMENAEFFKKPMWYLF